MAGGREGGLNLTHAICVLLCLVFDMSLQRVKASLDAIAEEDVLIKALDIELVIVFLNQRRGREVILLTLVLLITNLLQLLTIEIVELDHRRVKVQLQAVDAVEHLAISAKLYVEFLEDGVNSIDGVVKFDARRN